MGLFDMIPSSKELANANTRTEMWQRNIDMCTKLYKDTEANVKLKETYLDTEHAQDKKRAKHEMEVDEIKIQTQVKRARRESEMEEINIQTQVNRANHELEMEKTKIQIAKHEYEVEETKIQTQSKRVEHELDMERTKIQVQEIKIQAQVKLTKHESEMEESKIQTQVKLANHNAYIMEQAQKIDQDRIVAKSALNVARVIQAGYDLWENQIMRVLKEIEELETDYQRQLDNHNHNVYMAKPSKEKKDEAVNHLTSKVDVMEHELSRAVTASEVINRGVLREWESNKSNADGE
jgi:hypothetical protein